MNRKEPEFVLYLSIVIIWSVYLSIRATYVPPVFDEATTFFTYIATGEIFPFSNYPSANNHIFNTLGAWFFYQVLPPSLLSLRMLSLLSFPLFALAGYKLGKTFTLRRSRWLLWTLLFGVHFAIEFFAYSRGYAWSFTALLWVLYLGKVYQKSPSKKVLIQFLCWITLGLGFNLNTLPFAVIALMWLYYIQGWFTLRNSFFVAIFGLLPLGFFTYYGFYLKQHDQLYFGDSGNWFETTIPSLSEAFFSSASSGAYALFIVWLIIAFAAIVYSFKFLPLHKISLSIFSLFGSIVALTLLYYVYRVNLPQDRVALILYFLLAVSVPTAVEHMKVGFLSTLFALATGLITVPFLFQFNVNSSSNLGWRYEQVPIEFLEKLNGENSLSSSISSHYLMAKSYQLQQHLYFPDLPNIQSKRDTHYTTDYVIRPMGKTSEYFRKRYILVNNDDNTQKALWKLRTKNWKLIDSTEFTFEHTYKEFLPIYTFHKDSMKSDWSKVIIHFTGETWSLKPIFFSTTTHYGEMTKHQSIPFYPEGRKRIIETFSYPINSNEDFTKIDLFFHNSNKIEWNNVKYKIEVYSHQQNKLK